MTADELNIAIEIRALRRAIEDRTQWEYKMIEAYKTSIEVLNTLGSEGWEIISLNIDDNVILLKRQK